ncbi:MAG: SCO family protein [Bacteroidota bacterium]
MMRNISIVFGFLLLLISCSEAGSESEPRELPFLGIAEEGEHYIIPPFAFVDQEGAEITESNVDGKIHVVDFFFTSCPDICPKMNQQMLRVYDEYENDDEILILSHTLDPKRDTVEALKTFSEGLGVSSEKWKMLSSPDHDYVFEVCKTYMIAAGPDESIMGGIFHSGKFVLLDKERRVRGFYEGTDEDEVSKLIQDIKSLKAEGQKGA